MNRERDMQLSDETGTIDDADAKGASGERALAYLAESRALTTTQMEERRLIHRDDDSRGTADAFREIRTRLLSLGGVHNFVTMVTAVSPGSGASFVARNLAAAFAFDEAKNSLLIDCNLRYPGQHRAFGVDANQGGLIDYLDHPSKGIDRVVYRTGVPRLRLLPAGVSREMSGEYFSSFRMRALVDSLRSQYAERYLFLDGPPLKGSPDARILSDLADFIVVVAAYGKDTAHSIRQAVASLDQNKVAGVVFNHTP
ncbi:MAG TPA: polysaccharide biosynthesis protein [Rudaea sp.]|jgi:Mrp family chromosome partitioning ATPase|nr:polysaccharide biosynthesis protein [Rudaea sp.]